MQWAYQQTKQTRSILVGWTDFRKSWDATGTFAILSSCCLTGRSVAQALLLLFPIAPLWAPSRGYSAETDGLSDSRLFGVSDLGLSEGSRGGRLLGRCWVVGICHPWQNKKEGIKKCSMKICGGAAQGQYESETVSTSDRSATSNACQSFFSQCHFSPSDFPRPLPTFAEVPVLVSLLFLDLPVFSFVFEADHFFLILDSRLRLPSPSYFQLPQGPIEYHLFMRGQFGRGLGRILSAASLRSSP